MWLRSACRTREPSGSTRTSSAPVTSMRPSGSQLVAQPEAVGAVSDDLAVAVQVDGDDLVRPPVGEPQATVVPPRRLGHGEPVEQDERLHGWH